ncbi:MAG TPA: bifunctional methylenetetrahydrofolate dehydrogenase/methenyltetrahydrofolate cyclohydrolase FolD [Patescibacteria group bacterium]|nr:bifunctional methylenetetrahydrofolate dehydrogenase/methenyltetrahydrofolate cyclohydrolase FolD [Patescibacteria group bacterium]
MTARILDGRVYAAKIKERVAREVQTLKSQYDIHPGLATVIVGEDEASKVYVAAKHKGCEELGICSEILRMPQSTSREELLARIESLNNNPRIHGILVQLPLPAHLAPETAELLNRIQPDKDVDGFHPVNVGRLGGGEERLVPCTPYGCIKMLEMADIPVGGKKAVILGRSNVIGKPMFHLLLARNATVTMCHAETADLAAVCRTADILVAAAGSPGFVTADMVKPGAVVIDAGINRVPGEKRIVGDVDFASVKEVAGCLTPVPGGVGTLTLAMLLYNTVRAAQLQHKIFL